MAPVKRVSGRTRMRYGVLSLCTSVFHLAVRAVVSRLFDPHKYEMHGNKHPFTLNEADQPSSIFHTSILPLSPCFRRYMEVKRECVGRRSQDFEQECYCCDRLNYHHPSRDEENALIGPNVE